MPRTAAAAACRFDERLREISLGSWDGLDKREIRRRAPELFDGEEHWEWYFRSPDGETYDGFAGRIAAWLADLGDGPVIAVATASSPASCAASMPA